MKVADKVIKYIKEDNSASFGLDEAVAVTLTGETVAYIKIPFHRKECRYVPLSEYTTEDGSLSIAPIVDVNELGASIYGVEITAHPFPASSHLWNGPDILPNTKYRSMLASLFHDLIWEHRKELAAAWGVSEKDVLGWGDGVLYAVWMYASSDSFIGRIEARLAWEVCEFSKGWYHDAKKLIGLHSLLFALLLMAGCGTPPDWRVVEISGTNAVLRAMGRLPDETSSTNAPVVVAEDATTTPEAAQPTSADAVDFSTLDFCWGGFKGGSAKAVDGVEIGSLKVSASKMTYKWVSGGCERLGAANKSDANCLACLFCLIDGRWVGGKFDWISTSRTSRSLTNIAEGYHGWDRDAVSKADAYAFVIISDGGRLRSNVTMEGK